MVYAPGGEFLMGSPGDDASVYGDEKPQHRVQLDGFWIGQTQVTNAQFRQFIEAGGYQQEQHWSEEGWRWTRERGVSEPACWGDLRINGPEQPVVGVSWYEAKAYARWAGGRLPTEAEWEYAARGGPLSRGYRYAGSDEPQEVAWYYHNAGGRTKLVGQKKANELGLYDMSGNVYEWVSDWYADDYYTRCHGAANPQGPASGTRRVVRGGCWYSSPTSVRGAYRLRYLPAARNNDIGFRLSGSAVGL
jgi:formylglycine-generating enzyme required for sulfatase activity